MRHKDKHTPSSSSVAANMGWNYSLTHSLTPTTLGLGSPPSRTQAQTLRRILFADASSSVPATKMKAQTLKPICLISTTVPAPTSPACVILAIALLRLRRDPLHTICRSVSLPRIHQASKHVFCWRHWRWWHCWNHRGRPSQQIVLRCTV